MEYRVSPRRSATRTRSRPVVEGALDHRAQRRLPIRAGGDRAEREVDVVLPVAVEPRPGAGGERLSVDAQRRVAMLRRPLGKLGVVALAGHHQRGMDRDLASPVPPEHPIDDGVRGLRLDRDVAVGTVLGAEPHEEQAQEVVDLGHRPHGALVAAARGALLDRHRGRDAEDRVHVGSRRRLHELARVGVERLQVPALTLGEEDVERDGALAAAAHPRDHREPITRDVDVGAVEVVLAGVADGDRAVAPRPCASRRCRQRRGLLRALGGEVRPQRRPRVTSPPAGDGARPAGRDHPSTAASALRAEVDDPVGGGDHVEVVLDDEYRVAGCEQRVERGEQA